MAITIVIISLILLWFYIYLHHTFKKDRELIEQSINAISFFRNFVDYKGFVICTDEQIILNDIRIYRRVVKHLQKKKEWIIVNLSKDEKNHLNPLDIQLLSQLEINIYPTIAYFEKGSANAYKVSFDKLHGLTDEQLISELNMISGQVIS